MIHFLLVLPGLVLHFMMETVWLANPAPARIRFFGNEKGPEHPGPAFLRFDKTLLRALVTYFSHVPVHFKRLARRGCRLVCRWPFTGSSIASSRRLSVSFHFLTNMRTQRIGIHSG
jgi:hypothetical protein